MTKPADQTALRLDQDPAHFGLLIDRVGPLHFCQVGQFWTGVESASAGQSEAALCTTAGFDIADRASLSWP